MTEPPQPPDQQRLTFLTTTLTPLLGIQQALLQLTTELARRRRVEVLVLHDPGEVSLPGVTVTSLDAGTDRASRSALRRRLRRTGSDETLVVAGVWAAAQLLLAAPWQLRSALVWEHSLTPARLSDGRRFRLRAELVARCYRHCAGVVSVSPLVAACLRERWGVGSVVIPNLLDLPAESPGRRGRFAANRAAGSRPVRLLTVGAARAVKNYDVLLRALPLLNLDWRLSMAGGGPQVAELRALAEKLGVAERVHWLGYVDDPHQLLVDSHLLVHPSASETFGYVLLEAAEHWVPVVACDAPVMDDLVPELVPGLLTEPEPVALARTIEEAVSRFAPASTIDLFLAADARRRRHFDRSSTLAAWEEVLDG